jgi:hypothetical protein
MNTSVPSAWMPGWVGPTDYRCVECHAGFMPDEVVYMDKHGIPFHNYCVSTAEFSNRFSRGGSCIMPQDRKLGGTK